MTFDHADIVERLRTGYPDAVWSYDGDGTTLGEAYDERGELCARGLEWHSDGKPPTMGDLEAVAMPEKAPPAIEDALAGLVGWPCKQFAGCICSHENCRPSSLPTDVGSLA